MKKLIFFTCAILTGLSANIFLSPAFSAEKVAPVEKKEKSEKTYIASVMGHPKYYHRPSCRVVGTIKPSNMVIFSSQKKAGQHNYAPCPVCKP